MATVNFLLLSKKNHAAIYVRYSNGRKSDFMVPTGLSINPIHFDKKKQVIRNLIELPNRDAINKKLAKLKIFIIDQSNIDFSQGDIINRQWLKNTTATFFTRPKQDEKGKNFDHTLYLSSFADWWMKNKASSWKVSSGKVLPERSKAHYAISVKDIQGFEGKDKIRLKNVDSDLLDKLVDHLVSKNYQRHTILKKIDRVKFFCARAEAENLEVNKGYKSRVFVPEREEDFQEPYFNQNEINIIYNWDFSYCERLANTRDNLIIGLWTGLRVSDFLQRLKIEDFKDGYIKIKTLKTNTWVTLPIHRQVAEIIKKRKGCLPDKISDQKFNDYIKEIAFICNFDDEMMGGISQVIMKDGKPVIEKGKKVIRKIIGMYPKHLLVTSHICRRSFATNIYGTIPNISLQHLGGWSTEQMMLKYIKKSGHEHAQALAKVWGEN